MQEEPFYFTPPLERKAAPCYLVSFPVTIDSVAEALGLSFSSSSKGTVALLRATGNVKSRFRPLMLNRLNSRPAAREKARSVTSRWNFLRKPGLASWLGTNLIFLDRVRLALPRSPESGDEVSTERKFLSREKRNISLINFLNVYI